MDLRKRGKRPFFLWFFLLVLSGYGFIAYAINFSASYLEEISKQYGEYPKRRLMTWEKLTNNYKNAEDQEKLKQVNTFFNMLLYQSDLAHWGIRDYWATPLEFVVSGGGDCEDFAVAKYFTLLDMGVKDEKLLLMYVKYLKEGSGYAQAHMVLLYYPTPEGIPIVLDNINKEILPADKRTDLKPIYGFNGTGLWQAKELGKGHKIGQATDTKRWQDLLTRMKSGKITK